MSHSPAVDTSVDIHLVTGASDMVTNLRSEMADPAHLVVSALAIAECLVRPTRAASATDLALYDRWFGSEFARVIPFDATIARETARLRGEFDLRFVDAAHLATAVIAEAPQFFTTDRDFRRCVGRVPIDVCIITP